MVVGRIEGGRIELTTPLPQEWEGLAVKVEPCTPDDAVPDLEDRLRALHALGPMEYKLGECDAFQRALTVRSSFWSARRRP